ncbi:hypothetical protein [Flaviaesturariibacter amylovorans]|uniref:DUF1186 domain-containing protein n=1 Tax=Flaviaesturariibacter amylovorans TaxID=1084520 RepID=A0ABP8H8T5_9BACT
MLPATKHLSDLIRMDIGAYEAIRAGIRTVLYRGDRTDARALLEVFLERPFQYERGLLLPVFARHGDPTFAPLLAKPCLEGERLHAEAPAEVLEVLGSLQWAPARAVLHHYALVENDDYYNAASATLGLLHVDCSEWRAVIEAAVRATLGKNLFPEFVPALVATLPNRVELLPELYHSGREWASTDCNAGLLLGFAGSGEAGFPWFLDALLDPCYEAGGSGTGTRYHAYRGMILAGLTFRELFDHVLAIADEEQQRYALGVLRSLLEVKCNNPELSVQDPESFPDTYHALLRNSLRETLVEASARYAAREEAEELRTLVEIRIRDTAGDLT